MELYRLACSALPAQLQSCFLSFENQNPEELRLRIDRSPGILRGGWEIPVRQAPIQRRELEGTVEKITGASLAASMDQLRAGYLSYRGLRVGFCACARREAGTIHSFSDFSSLSIRIPAAEIPQVDTVAAQICTEASENIWIISPPGAGKTSLLRAMIRYMANQGTRVAVVDERNELACANDGKFFYDLGRCSDVLVGVGKAEGAMMLLRGMNPQIIVMDEISREEDLEAVRQITGCGVRVFATAHGSSLASIRKRPSYAKLLEDEIFQTLVFISLEKGARRYLWHGAVA